MPMRYPLVAWHYRVRLAIEGSDRQNLADALEEEGLALFEHLPRATAYEQIREGHLAFDVSLLEPFTAFPQDLSVLSLFLFTVVKGFEVAERFVAEGVSDDARAWKVLARRGEWVRVPLRVTPRGDGTFHVDEDADDLEVVAARWAHYPLWFQDGMRRKYPALRRL
jgi:hypothetical protein